jgi:coniferyl-aldehyde dehydrogenase
MDTPITHLGALLQAQRAAWHARTPGYAQRMDDLARLRHAFKARLEDFVRAVSDDFGHRPRVEVAITRASSTMRSTPGCVRGWTKRARQVRGSSPCTRFA